MSKSFSLFSSDLGLLSIMRIHKSSSVIFFIPTESKFKMIEISDFDNLEKMNLEHTDLENYNHIAEPRLFRNRPAPIVSEYKKNNDEQKDVQQTIHDAEMETEQIIECTTTETSNVTKTSFLIDRPAHENLGRGRAKMAVPRSPDTEWETKLFEIRFFQDINRDK